MKFEAIKGVGDILPPESALWNRVEQTARETFGSFGFAEIRLPIFEQTELFARSVGQETDIVSKEMYAFEDKGSGELAILRDVISAFNPALRTLAFRDSLIAQLGKYFVALNTPGIQEDLPRDENNS